MNVNNAAILTQIALQVATSLQTLLATQAKAAAEGREPTDAEVADARAANRAASDALDAGIAARGG